LRITAAFSSNLMYEPSGDGAPCGADDDRLDDVALLDVAAGDGVLDGGDDDVTDTGVATAGSTENTDAEDLLRTGVVGDLEVATPAESSTELLSSAGSRRTGEPGRTDMW
jgi:hypothetical protein